MRRLLTPAILAATLPAAAIAEERKSLLDFFSVDILVQRALQSGIMALRTQMDLQYSDISVDILTGRITVTDFIAWPLPEWDDEGTCEVAADRLTMRGGALDVADRFRIKAQFSGLSLPDGCFPPDIREALEVAKVEVLDIPRLTLDIDYHVPSSGATMRMYADITDVATVDMSADFAYIWMDARDPYDDPLPVVFLDSATLAIENGGVWDALLPLVPPPFTGEGAGQVIEGMIGQGIQSENRDDAPLSAAQNAFVASLVASWPAFLADPQTLVLETNIDGDTYLDFEAMDRDLQVVFDTLQPTVGLAPNARSEILPTALLQAAMNGDASVSAEDAKRVGVALITGVGAPRQVAKGTEILQGLVASGDGAVALILAEAIAGARPADAYKMALSAGQTGEIGATALLDRLERKLSFAKVLELQAEISGGETPSGAPLESVSLMSAEAAKRFSGRGQARSYEIAAMWAMLAAAAGDAEAQDIVEDIAERARLSSDEAVAAWDAAQARASEAAMGAWLGQDLATKFSK